MPEMTNPFTKILLYFQKMCVKMISLYKLSGKIYYTGYGDDYLKKTKIAVAILLVFCMLFTITCCGDNNTAERDRNQTAEIVQNEPQNNFYDIKEEKNSDREEQIIQSDNSFEIHFIDVGQADSALVISNGKTMLIDGGNVADSDLVYTYLKNHNINILNYVVLTHAHEDHVGGLSGALSYAKAEKIYSTGLGVNTKAYNNFIKKVSEQGVSLTKVKAGDTFMLGKSKVQIVGPINVYTDDLNNSSVMLKVTYGSTSFLFTGDAEEKEEKDVINAGFNLRANLLKVGHHGSDTSTSYVFLREVMPEFSVISVGKGTSYGHPKESTLSKLRDAGSTVYRTDMQGDIIVKSDGKTLSFTTAKSSDGIITNPTEQEKNSYKEQIQTEQYIGNRKSKMFHRQTCRSLPAEQNRVYFASGDEAKSDGYIPCKKCNP